MNFVVVDTDVVSFYLKGDSRFAAYTPFLEGQRLVMSFMTYGELLYWQEIRKWGEKKRKALAAEIRSNYIVHPGDRSICTVWAAIRADAQSKGLQIQVADAWIAATAMALNVALVSHNWRDFENVDGLNILTAESDSR